MISVIAILVVLLAAIAVTVSYLNMKRIEHRVSELPEEYRRFYIDANEAIGLSSMKRSSKKYTMEMILEILEHANSDGRSISDVVGPDSEAFLNGFIQASGGQLSPLYLFGYALGNFVIYILFIKVYKVARNGSFNPTNISTETLDIGIVLTYALIAFIFLPWLLVVMQRAASRQWNGLKRIWIVLPFIIPAGLMALLIFIDTPALRRFLDQPLPLLTTLPSIIIGILLVPLSFLISGYARKRQLKKTTSQF